MDRSEDVFLESRPVLRRRCLPAQAGAESKAPGLVGEEKLNPGSVSKNFDLLEQALWVIIYEAKNGNAEGLCVAAGSLEVNREGIRVSSLSDVGRASSSQEQRVGVSR